MEARYFKKKKKRAKRYVPRAKLLLWEAFVAKGAELSVTCSRVRPSTAFCQHTHGLCHTKAAFSMNRISEQPPGLGATSGEHSRLDVDPKWHQGLSSTLSPASVDVTILTRDSSVITFYQPFLVMDFILISVLKLLPFTCMLKIDGSQDIEQVPLKSNF